MIVCYVIWGNKLSLYAEAVFSLLTFLPDSHISEICVVTDHPNYLCMVEGSVTIVPVDGQTFDGWGGNSNFLFRKKIKGIEKVVSLYPGRDVLYLDTDTFHGGDMAVIAQALAGNKVCMGDSSGYIGKAKDRNNRELYAKIRDRTFCGYRVGEKSIRLNAGMVGLPAAHASEILADAIGICDELYKLTGYVGSEEVAFSFALGKFAAVTDIGATIGHYWGNKTQWGGAIRDFLMEHALRCSSLAQMTQAAAAFDFKKMPTYTHKPKRHKQLVRLAEKFWPLTRQRYFPEQPKQWL